MSQLIIQSIHNQKIDFKKENSISLNDFLNTSIEYFIIEHHKAFSDISIFQFVSQHNKENICFIISQNQHFNKQFKMLETDKINDPKRTMDLFGTGEEQFQIINLLDLFQQLDKEQANFQLSFDGRDYSFKLVVGNKMKSTLKKLDSYIESNVNLKNHIPKNNIPSTNLKFH